MRQPSTVIRSVVAGAVAALVALLLSTSFALAKGESAGLITLAAPIHRDAEPGSTLTVEFTATLAGANGQSAPLRGSPVVLQLIGPDGTTTEGLATEGATPGSYTVTIKAPASGITSAIFGLRGSAVNADGTSSLEDLPFDVNGLLFTTTAHLAPAAKAGAGAAATPPSTAPDYRPAIAGALAITVAGLALVLVIGRRRSLRSA